MRISAALPGDLHAVAAGASRAQALGVDMLTAEETAHEPFSRLTLAAEHTTRAGLATSVAIAFARSPYVTAHIAWVLDAVERRARPAAA